MKSDENKQKVKLGKSIINGKVSRCGRSHWRLFKYLVIDKKEKDT